MDKKIDIQMPVKNGGFVVGDVIDRLYNQQNVEITTYIDDSEDFPSLETHEDILDLVAGSDKNKERIKTTILAAYKRNKMLRLGVNPYVYLADPDVLIPLNNDILAGMARGLDRHPVLGAVGVPYYNNNHVAAGSMMLRKDDLSKIGELKYAGASCVCAYIARKLLDFDLYTIALKTFRAKHLKWLYKKIEEAIKNESSPSSIEIAGCNYAIIKEIDVMDSHILNKTKLDNEVAKVKSDPAIQKYIVSFS